MDKKMEVDIAEIESGPFGMCATLTEHILVAGKTLCGLTRGRGWRVRYDQPFGWVTCKRCLKSAKAHPERLTI